MLCRLRYMLGVCPAAMHDKTLACECGRPFSPGQATGCRCCAGVCTVCNDISVESGWRTRIHKSGQHSTKSLPILIFRGSRSSTRVWSMISALASTCSILLAVLGLMS